MDWFTSRLDRTKKKMSNVESEISRRYSEQSTKTQNEENVQNRGSDTEVLNVIKAFKGEQRRERLAAVLKTLVFQLRVVDS